MDRTKTIKSSTFFGGPSETKDADENGTALEEGEGTFVSSLADEPAPKRSKTTAASVDIVEKVGRLHSSRSTALNSKKNCTQPAVDFFGRLIMTPTADKNKPASSRKKGPSYVVSFKFRAGNSAAVRKPVKMASFL
jgi:chromosome transmission fidelity protein 18